MLGISEEELDNQCDETFKDPPVVFLPRKGNKVDESIAQLIKELNITIPIVFIKAKLYLIGSQRANCEL